MNKICTHHSTVWWWDETTVNREKAAAHENLPRKTTHQSLGFRHFAEEQMLWNPTRPGKHFSPSPSTPCYLNELLSAVKLWHQNVLPVGQSGEGHAELPGGPKVGVRRKLLQQGVPHCPQQAEGRVENSQSVFSGLFRHVQNINTELFWGGTCGQISLWCISLRSKGE